MTNQEVYDRLDSTDTSIDKKKYLAVYLHQQLERQKAHPEDGMQIAYQIAGLLNTDFTRSLSDDDPYLQIFYNAGQLELPQKHRGDVTWEQMENLINQLPH